MEQIDNIYKLKADTQTQLNVLIAQRKDLNEKINKLAKIVKECEASIILFGKYNAIVESGTDIAGLIADDNLRIMDALDGEYKGLVEESIADVKAQIQNVAVDLLKREEAMGVKERTVNELATVLTAQGDTATAELIKTVAISEKIVEAL